MRSIPRQSSRSERRVLLGTVLTLAFLAAVPLAAGTIYVPLAADVELGSMVVRTEIRLVNLGGETRVASALFLPAEADGTLPNRADATTIELAPGAETVLDGLVPPGALGMVEITADPDIHVSTYLSGFAPSGRQRLGSALPVASSSSLTPSGAVVYLHGLERRGKLRADLVLANLDSADNVCAVAAFDGDTLAAEGSWTVPPLTVLALLDVFSELNLTPARDVDLAITCSGDALPFALQREVQTGELVVRLPAASGDSTLEPPGTVPPPPPPAPSSACLPGDAFAAEGVFHRPRRNGRETWEARVLGPRQRFELLILEMDVTLGNWDTNSPEGNHAFFWLHRDERWRNNVYGYLNAFGPGKNFARLGTNITKDIAPQVTRNATFEPGKTYHIRYIVEPKSNTARAIITNAAGREIVRLRDTGIGRFIDTGAQGLRVIVGHPARKPGQAGPEVPTYGWKYANLCVRVR